MRFSVNLPSMLTPDELVPAAWSFLHGSQQLTTAFIACLLPIMTEKPVQEVNFQSFSKKKRVMQ